VDKYFCNNNRDMGFTMFVLSKIFGEYPQVKILEVFADHFDEELSISDIMWLTDMPKTTVKQYISKLLDEKILLKGGEVVNTQLYCLNKQKQEVQIVVSLVNYIVSEKLAERLEERGLEPY
jgi:DNA-binding IclR family transcriptional regulator